MKKWLLLSLLIALAFSGVQAQSAEPPLILWIKGDLYSADPSGTAPTAITSSGTISGPVLSPDEQHIAYKAADPIGLDALSQVQSSGTIADFDLPGDIYLFDLASQQESKVAAQPSDASLFVEGTPDKATIRSTPVWSPDGTRLAWTEFAYPSGQPSIVVYDLSSEQTRLIASNIDAPIVQGQAPPLRWGGGGIAVNASADAAGEQDYLFFGDDGALRSTTRLAAVDGDAVTDFVWVESADGAQLGLLYGSARWTLIDPATGVAHAASIDPTLVTKQSGSMALRFGHDPDYGFFWEIVGANAAAPGSPDQVTLSPSGQLLAFIGFPSSGAASIWSDGNATPITGTGSNLNELQVGAILWGYTYWHL